LFRDDCVEVLRWKCSADLGGSTVEMRRSWYLFSFTHSGSALVHSGNHAQLVDATRVMVIQPGEPFHLTRFDKSRSLGGSVLVRPDLFEKMAGRDVADSGAVFDTPTSALLLQHFLLRRAEEPADPAVTDTALAIIRETLRARREMPSNASPPTDTTLDVQTLLSARFREHLRLADIARAVNRSPSHVCRTFHHETGMRMRGYLQRLRIYTSVSEVIDCRNLSTLAHSLGYCSHSHFAEVFRRELGVTPVQVRRIAALPTLARMRRALDA
jgi:AraC-like DNA-binding protein